MTFCGSAHRSDPHASSRETHRMDRLSHWRRRRHALAGSLLLHRHHPVPGSYRTGVGGVAVRQGDQGQDAARVRRRAAAWRSPGAIGSINGDARAGWFAEMVAMGRTWDCFDPVALVPLPDSGCVVGTDVAPRTLSLAQALHAALPDGTASVVDVLRWAEAIPRPSGVVQSVAAHGPPAAVDVAADRVSGRRARVRRSSACGRRVPHRLRRLGSSRHVCRTRRQR